MPQHMPDSHIPVKAKYACAMVARSAPWAHNGCMKNLHRIRTDRGLSQMQLAEMVGCNQSMISKIEKGTANPPLDLIEAIAAALRTTPVALFGLPEVQQRALDALSAIDPGRQEAALVVLEAMARK